MLTEALRGQYEQDHAGRDRPWVNRRFPRASERDIRSSPLPGVRELRIRRPGRGNARPAGADPDNNVGTLGNASAGFLFDEDAFARSTEHVALHAIGLHT